VKGDECVSCMGGGFEVNRSVFCIGCCQCRHSLSVQHHFSPDAWSDQPVLCWWLLSAGRVREPQLTPHGTHSHEH